MKIAKKLLFIVLVLAFTLYISPLHISAENDKIETILNEMTNEEKIALMIMPSLEYNYSDLQNNEIYNNSYKNAINNYNFAGFILFGGAVNNIEESIKTTNYLQSLNKNHKTRLFIAIDQEGGYVSRLGIGTTLLGNMGLAATGNEKNAYNAGVIIGKELASLGINLNFSPVVDVNTNPSNPDIGIRSFSDSPELVSKFGKSMMNGIKDSGVITTLKHFPGLGDTNINFETNRGNIDKSLDELLSNDLIPFKDLIKNDAEVIMISHAGYPKLDDTIYDDTNNTLPASLSKKIITNILREQLGYSGIVITDAMNMKSIKDYFDPIDAKIKAINAGVDIILDVLYPSELANIGNTINTLASKVGNEINEENVNNAVRRILKLKDKYGLLNNYVEPNLDNLTNNAKSLISTKENHTIEFNMAKEAITMVKNDSNIIPLKDSDKTLFLYYFGSHKNVIDTALKYLINDSEISNLSNIESYRFNNFNTINETKSKMDNFDNIVIMNGFYDDSNINGTVSPRIDELIEYAHNKGKKVIYLSSHLPYDSSRFQSADAIICTYLANGISFNIDDYETNFPKYSANTIAGVYMLYANSINFNGKLPVNIYKISEDNNYYTREILYERGFGLIKYGPANYDSLISYINDANELLKSNIYTDNSKNNLNNKYQEAINFKENNNNLLEDNQSLIDNMAKELKIAIESLIKKSADTTTLNNNMNKTEELFKNSDEYTTESIDALRKVYNNAKEFINNNELSIDKQEEINQLANSIRNAINNLRKNNNEIIPEEKKEDKPIVIDDSFEILSGKDQTIEDNDLEIKLSNTSKLNKVIVDNKELNKVNYSINKDNIFILRNNYLKTLGEGKHEITFVFGEKKISTNFYIKSTKIEESSSSFNIIPFIIAGIVATTLVVIGILLKKKKNA